MGWLDGGMSPLWVERYIGIPFADEGFGFSGSHCWGLVRLVLLTERRIDLPAYGEISASDLLSASRTMGAQSIAEPWLPVVGPRSVFDVVLMRSRPDGHGLMLGHVGIMVDGENLLHIEKHTDSVCVPIEHPSVRHRLAATFRHKALM